MISKDLKDFNKQYHTDYYEGYFHALDITRIPDDENPNRVFNYFERKNSINSTPYGNFISKDQIKDPNLIKIKTTVNNNIIFDTDYRNLTFSIENFMDFLAKETSIIRGDIILCGAEKMSDELIKKNDKIKSELFYDGKKISELIFIIE